MDKFLKLTAIVPFIISFSVFTGCGGSGGNNNPPPINKPQIYTVAFNSNGGSSVPLAQVNQGGTLPSPNTPVRACYDFEGWYNNSELTAIVTFPYTVTQNTKLYAKWTWAVIEISDSAELNNIRNNLTCDYRLVSDISLEAYGDWAPIGSVSVPFSGKIDGDNYIITGLKIDNETEDYAGLFGYIKGSTITNLALENVDIAGGEYAGAIVGYIEDGSITNSYSTGSVTSSSSSSQSYSGGIAGIVLNSTITGSYSEGIITASSPPTDFAYSGGIAGYMSNSIITDSHSFGRIDSSSYSGGIAGYLHDGIITGSYSEGSITSSSLSPYLPEFNDYSPSSGGITGFSYGGKVTDSYSMGNITSSFSSGGITGFLWFSTITGSYSKGIITSSFYSGGIAGSTRDYSEITDSYSTGNIISSSETPSVTSYSGGITGFIWNSAINNCHSEGNITSSNFYSGYSGGIAGLVSNSTITNCYSKGNVVSSSFSSSSAAGGIAGNTQAATITNCYSLGNITSSISSSNSIASAGGIVGELSGGSVFNCYSTGDVTSTSSSFAFNTYYTYSGGIAGHAWGEALITNCYSTGNIYATVGYPGGIVGKTEDSTTTNCAAINKTINLTYGGGGMININPGRIAGLITNLPTSSSFISNNFALNTMTATSAVFNTTDIRYYGVSKTDGELKEQSTYSDAIIDNGDGGLGWKFGGDDDAPWKMPNGGGYPILYWQ